MAINLPYPTTTGNTNISLGTTTAYPMWDVEEPADESEEFRDFVVWLCGYTSRHTPPDKAEWEELRDEAKKIAAKFALATRARRQLGTGVRHAHATAGYSALSSGTTTTYSSAGIAGNQALTGNEETFK